MASQRYYTINSLGPKRHLTPDGYLLVEDVPIARTGTLIYGPNETPIAPGPDGVVRIHRTPEEVFRPESLMSLAGKPIVDDHPTEDVNPRNWRDHARGVVLNPRPGTGAFADCLIGDILITDAAMIKAVQDGKREVSGGYEAEYDELGPGEGRQRNIIFNHVAVVDRGRCGSRCAFGDHAAPAGAAPMDPTKPSTTPPATAAKKSWMDKIRAAFQTKDEAALEEALAAPEEHTHIHVHAGAGDDAAGGEEEPDAFEQALEARFSSLEQGHAEILTKLGELHSKLEAPAKTADAAAKAAEEAQKALETALAGELPDATQAPAVAKARDSAALADSFQETVALAEILVPGIRIPTYDRAAAPKATLDAVCGLRRTAIDLAYHAPVTRAIIDELLGGQALDVRAMTCDAVRTLFRGAASARKAQNKSPTAVPPGAIRSKDARQPIRSPAELNKLHAERWAKKVHSPAQN